MENQNSKIVVNGLKVVLGKKTILENINFDVKDGEFLSILGPSGCGKTTLLRDLIRQIARREHVGVVDERGELFPDGFYRGERTDVLRECPKGDGIDMLLRTMGPDTVAMDEITAQADCEALLQAGWCGVRLMATAHAGSLRDLETRPLYRPILNSGLFDRVIVLSRDKTWQEERLIGC